MAAHTVNTMDNKRSYGATIEAAMDRAKMTKAQLARTVGVRPATIQYAITERGPRGEKLTPKPNTLVRIADALDIDPSTLLLEAGLPKRTVEDLLDTPPETGMDVSDLDLPDQLLIKRFADLLRDQEKYR